VKKTATIAAAATLLALSLSACGDDSKDDDASDKPSTGSSSSSTASETPSEAAKQYPDFKACIVSDTGGFNDHSFNEIALAGLDAAGKTYGVKTAKVQSKADSDYADNLATLVGEGCNEITSVGFLLATDTLDAAKKNKDVDFAIIDNAYTDDKGNPIKLPDNLKELTFQTDQAAYLAGYLAAGTSKSGVVGTLGGLQIPTVTIFMDGFLAGINAYNKDNDADVKLLGWDGSNGSFSSDFGDTSKCKTIAEQQIQQGADIVFPVAGGCGLGALEAAKAKNDLGIWVDSDGYESTDYGSILLTSVVKRVDNATTTAVADAASGAFDNKPYVGTLENDGVGLAPYHDLDSVIDGDLKSKIEELKAGIIDGSVTVG
jgi:basic membrane protein A